MKVRVISATFANKKSKYIKVPEKFFELYENDDMLYNAVLDFAVKATDFDTHINEHIYLDIK